MRESAYLSAEQVTENMRRHGTGVRATVATRHPPYGWAMGSPERRGLVLHRVQYVRMDWRTAARADILAVWVCGGFSQHPAFVVEPPPGVRRCRKCEAAQ